MTTICKEFIVATGIEEVWDALRDFNALHQRLAPGFVVDCQPGEGSRTVTFANGFVVKEVLLGIHEDTHRLSYTVVGGRASHHFASAQLFAEGDRHTRFVWITDVLPDSFGSVVDGLMTQGVAAMKQALAPHRPGAQA